MNRDRIYRMAWVLAAAIPLVSASVAQAGAPYYNCASTNNGWDDGITADWFNNLARRLQPALEFRLRCLF